MQANKKRAAILLRPILLAFRRGRIRGRGCPDRWFLIGYMQPKWELRGSGRGSQRWIGMTNVMDSNQ